MPELRANLPKWNPWCGSISLSPPCLLNLTCDYSKAFGAIETSLLLNMLILMFQAQKPWKMISERICTISYAEKFRSWRWRTTLVRLWTPPSQCAVQLPVVGDWDLLKHHCSWTWTGLLESVIAHSQNCYRTATLGSQEPSLASQRGMTQNDKKAHSFDLLQCVHLKFTRNSLEIRPAIRARFIGQPKDVSKVYIWVCTACTVWTVCTSCTVQHVLCVYCVYCVYCMYVGRCM